MFELSRTSVAVPAAPSFQASSIMDIIERLESHNEYSESGDARQLRKDSAEEIRALRRQVAELEALIRHDRSKGSSRRAA